MGKTVEFTFDIFQEVRFIHSPNVRTVVEGLKKDFTGISYFVRYWDGLVRKQEWVRVDEIYGVRNEPQTFEVVEAG